MLICFECDQLEYFVRDRAGKLKHRAQAEFDPARPALLKLAKKALPDDKAIQDLPDKRSAEQ